MGRLKRLLLDWALGLESIMTVSGLQTGLGRAGRAMQLARQLDKAYEDAPVSIPPEYMRAPEVGLPAGEASEAEAQDLDAEPLADSGPEGLPLMPDDQTGGAFVPPSEVRYTARDGSEDPDRRR